MKGSVSWNYRRSTLDPKKISSDIREDRVQILELKTGKGEGGSQKPQRRGRDRWSSTKSAMRAHSEVQRKLRNGLRKKKGYTKSGNV